MPVIVIASGWLHSEFVRILFLQSHRETDHFVTPSGVQVPEHNRGGFHYRHSSFSSQIKTKTVSILGKVSPLCLILNIDGSPIISKSHTHPSHSQTSRVLTSSLSLGVPVPHVTQCQRHTFFILVYQDTMWGGHVVVDKRHVYEVEDTDPTPVEQISWYKVVHTRIRPFGQKSNLLSQHHQGFGIATRGLPRLWWGSSKRTNLNPRWHSSPSPTITHSPITLANLLFFYLDSIFGCSSPSWNTVYVRRIDLSALKFKTSVEPV